MDFPQAAGQMEKVRLPIEGYRDAGNRDVKDRRRPDRAQYIIHNQDVGTRQTENRFEVFIDLRLTFSNQLPHERPALPRPQAVPLGAQRVFRERIANIDVLGPALTKEIEMSTWADGNNCQIEILKRCEGAYMLKTDERTAALLTTEVNARKVNDPRPSKTGRSGTLEFGGQEIAFRNSRS